MQRFQLTIDFIYTILYLDLSEQLIVDISDIIRVIELNKTTDKPITRIIR